MKSVMISIKPYWVFLIIAKTMGWAIDKQKTVEVRKTFPKDNEWNKIGKIYCTKDKQSFNCIPKEYQPFMQNFLGKVIGEFVCDNIFSMSITYSDPNNRMSAREFSFTCLTDKQIIDYLGNGKRGYGWHISDLVIYDKPKELNEFYKPCTDPYQYCQGCKHGFVKYPSDIETYEDLAGCCFDTECLNTITRPPQSWCYVEGRKDR